MFQKWSPLNSTRIGIIVGLVAVGFANPISFAKKSQPKLPQLLQQVENKYKKARTIEAAVSQVDTIASMGGKEKPPSSGVIWLRLPNQFRWQTFSPHPSTVVSDGKEFWFYTPPFDESEMGQLIIRSSNKAQSKLLTALLGGSFSGSGIKEIKSLDQNAFELIPKKGTAGKVQKVTLTIDSQKKVIEKLVLTHRGGNTTTVTLSRVKLGKSLENPLFKFKIPPRTEVNRQ